MQIRVEGMTPPSIEFRHSLHVINMWFDAAITQSASGTACAVGWLQSLKTAAQLSGCLKLFPTFARQHFA